MDRKAPKLGNDLRLHLEHLAASSDRKLSRRARIALLSDQGQSDSQISAALGVSRKTVWRWRTRFASGGLAAIERERPRTGRKPRLREQVAQLIIEKTLSAPPDDAPRWSTRRLAEALGVSRAMVHRVWRQHGVVPPGSSSPPTSQ